MELRRQGSILSAIGLLLFGLAGGFAVSRGWAYGAKATLAGVFGIAYLLVGVLTLNCESVPQLFRRAVLSLPVAYVVLFGALQSANALAYGSVTLEIDTAVRALWATLLGYPVGLGYIYGRSPTTTLRRAVLTTALASILAGAVIGSMFWVDIWPSSVGIRFVFLSLVASGLVILGALPAYLIPTQFNRTATA
ncbi:MAG: hypothetical protein ABEJ05_08080 [Haloglomus sp.]